MATSSLKFEAISSSVDISFWQELEHRKLTLYKLGEESHPLEAEIAHHRMIGKNGAAPPLLSLDRDSFSSRFLVFVLCD
jgi:hypothetical protein